MVVMSTIFAIGSNEVTILATNGYASCQYYLDEIKEIIIL